MVPKTSALGHLKKFRNHRLGGTMFETILVAVDGSKHATKIAEVAADLA
jgi:hypothetical protein